MVVRGGGLVFQSGNFWVRVCRFERKRLRVCDDSKEKKQNTNSDEKYEFLGKMLGCLVAGKVWFLGKILGCLVAEKIRVSGKNWGKSGEKFWCLVAGVSETKNFGFLKRFEELQSCGNSKKKFKFG